MSTLFPTPEERAAVLEQHGVTANAVLDRVLKLTGLTKDVELADLFHVSKPTISTWRKRNKVPYEELVALFLLRKFDLVYALLGINFETYMHRSTADAGTTDWDGYLGAIVNHLELLHGRRIKREG